MGESPLSCPPSPLGSQGSGGRVGVVESNVRDLLLLRTPAGGAQSECSLDLKKQLLHEFFRKTKGRPGRPPPPP
ncbi:unnamed protein product [Rangifer tarandus platyrhynchus]|uniref:Uncharacterized protein n=1 Tax=Rangifer tarandus platyrhynchus TaxID=3082113 RepID=A0ABN8Z3S1_RANTA|nr:unnamed protein product [Rangifer tarandus platyrhynchus]